MDVINGFFNYVLPFVVILTILVFVHEMGHYLVARRNGVKVEVFSIGFGPEVLGWTGRSGTRWKISAIPLGGYVKMFGDTDPASTGVARDLTPDEQKVSFHHKRVGQRAAVVAAGPAANFLFAVLLLAGLYVAVGQPYTAPTVDLVLPNSAAAAAGLQTGDRVVSIEGQSVERFEDMQRIVMSRPGEPLLVVIDRQGRQERLSVTPSTETLTDRFGNQQRIGRLGVQSNQMKIVRHDPFTAVWQATRETWNLTMGTLHALGQMVTGKRSTDEIGGVLRIGQMSGEVTRDGFFSVGTIVFIALLSINLGLINLFPIPVLDGGHLIFYAAEAVRGRPLGKRVLDYGSMAGLAAVLALMIFATWNDLVHLRVVEFFASLIS